MHQILDHVLCGRVVPERVYIPHVGEVWARAANITQGEYSGCGFVMSYERDGEPFDALPLRDFLRLARCDNGMLGVEETRWYFVRATDVNAEQLTFQTLLGVAKLRDIRWDAQRRAIGLHTHNNAVTFIEAIETSALSMLSHARFGGWDIVIDVDGCVKDSDGRHVFLLKFSVRHDRFDELEPTWEQRINFIASNR